MPLGQYKRAVGVLPSLQAVEHALAELRNSGFDSQRISVVVKDTERQDQLSTADISDPVTNQAEAGAVTGAIAGTALGGLGGLLVGLGSLVIPGVGPVVAAGSVGVTLATTFAGSGIGAIAGSLAGAFAGIGIPEERAKVYSDRVSQGDYVLMMDGTDEEIHHAESVLNTQGVQEWGIYNPSDTEHDYQRDSTIESVERQVRPSSAQPGTKAEV
ncbi:hypothetical protein AVDCRST_MAG81-976 [uncultured Synechococcales cyanobacterium]|uniref:General stress protein 17M-like domain-containing protein n=1 Tax=uncultured Synechococcales cyanobacterium TaxID=1936017 RepID=A0A6J4V172_9CYAN|nr:hypothetical protein AVDCRST_MAG81-976 [uncultured Synechococcales cyanobacterium]